VLTTTKMDFLKHGTAVAKYYRFRKAIQDAIIPVLRELGALVEKETRRESELEPLRKEIEAVLDEIMGAFPELEPLFSKTRRGDEATGVIPDAAAPAIGALSEGTAAMTGDKGGPGRGAGLDIAPGHSPGERIEEHPDGHERGRRHVSRLRLPRFFLAFESDPSRQEMGWLFENTVFVNKAHPAFARAVRKDWEDYHAVVTVCWVLLQHVSGEAGAQFMNRFLSAWGKRS